MKLSVFNCSKIGDILAEKENLYRNIARWIILFVLCIDIGLIFSMHH